MRILLVLLLLAAPVQAQNVVLIVVDSLRADAVGENTPNISALAERGTTYTRCYTPAPWTLPAVASMVTGLPPSEHGANRKDERMRDDVKTIAEEMVEKGYSTLGVTANRFFSEDFGTARGYESFTTTTSNNGNVVAVLAAYMGTEFEEPFFHHIHFFNPHCPYQDVDITLDAATMANHIPEVVLGLPERLDGTDDGTWPGRRMAPDEVAVLKQLYDAEVREADRGVGAIIDHLDHLGVINRTAIIVTSDHGEEFFEHGALVHGRQVYEELVKVPLVIAGPKSEVRNYDEVVSLTGLYDMIVNDKDVCDTGGTAFGMTLLDDRNLAYYLDGHEKIIMDLDTGRAETFDLLTDPMERRGKDGDAMFSFDKILPGVKIELDEDSKRKLKALGY